MSSGADKIAINLSGMSNQEIKSSLISIYDKINKPPTKEVGYDLFLKLVNKNLHSPSQMNFIINHVSEFITPLEPKEKDPCLKLLSLIFYSPSNEEESIDAKIYFPYLSPVLTTLQNLIKDSNSSIFPTISNIFAEIVQNIMPTDIEASNIELDQEEKTAYEMMQGFCIYNMKYDDKSNRIVGSLCLTKLVENCPVVLQKQYMKLIWEVIMNLIDKKNFNAKYELLNCLISLILGAENLFMPYAHNTLYKVLDFLADPDWLKRKLALNVIYTLIFYCKEEILPLKEHIISFLRALKTDKVKEVREVCLLILKIFSENEPKNKENPKDKNKSNINPINNKNNRLINKNNENKNTNKNKNINIKTKNANQKKSGNILNKNSETDKSSNKFSECITPEMRDKDSRDTKSIDNIKSYSTKNDLIKDISEKSFKKFDNNNNKSSSGFIPEISEQENPINITNNSNTFNNSISKKTGMSSNIKNNMKDNTDAPPTNQNNIKLVNRKDDKTFINEKMVIKPDPNKSIFKSIPNPAFFNQAKKSEDIVLVSKKDPKKYINNVNNNKKEEEIVINVKEKEKPQENTKEKKDQEIKETTNKKVGVNTNKNENKEKINHQNNFKNKVAPIKRNKIEKKISQKEEKEKEEEIIINIDKKKEIKKEEIEEQNLLKKNKKEENDEIKDYKTYLNKNEEVSKKEDKKIKTKNEIDKNKNNYDPNIINNLLSQMNSLSQKQLSLIDIMDNIQMETQGQIKQLNKRISKLEKNVEELSNELYYLKNE